MGNMDNKGNKLFVAYPVTPMCNTAHMGDMDIKKSGRITGRIPGNLRARLDKIAQAHGVTDAKMVEDALEALADYVEFSGGYHRPMKMVAFSSPERATVYGVNESDNSLLSRMQAVLAAEAAKLRTGAENPPRG